MTLTGLRQLPFPVGLLLMLVPLAAEAEPPPNTWVRTADLSQVRREHTATLLRDGKVLVAGGSGNGKASGLHNSAELYDPTTESWSPTTRPLNHARRYHSATLLDDGKVLVVGGRDSEGVLASAELYEPTTRTWSELAALNIEARRDHTATLLRDGKVLVAGGRDTGDTCIKTAAVYDPGEQAWTQIPDLVPERRDHTATLLPDGKVLVTGGRGKDYEVLASARVYDPEEGAWSNTKVQMAVARQGHTATLLRDGRVLIAGGTGSHPELESIELNTAELYEPVTGEWRPTGTTMASQRTDHKAILLPDGKVLVVGGTYNVTVQGDSTELFAPAELYDPATDRWLPADSQPQARKAHTSTLLLDGRVLVTGGQNAQGLLNTAELYAPVTPPAEEPSPSLPGTPGDEEPSTPISSYYSSGCAASSPQALWPLALLLLVLGWRRT